MKIKVTPQQIPDVLLIEPTVFKDQRGYFKECFNQAGFESFLPDVKFVQDNESMSSYGVLRGIHFQRPPHAQAKLLRVVWGKIWDVAIDLRPGSPTFGKYVYAELSASNHKQIYIPQGFGHGFVVMSEIAIVQYKTDGYYHAESDAGIHPHDPRLNLPWPCPREDQILSEKDSNLPFLSQTVL